MRKSRWSARRMALDAMLAAMCAALGLLALDFGSLKVTFEALPVLLGALLFGPADGAAIGLLGTGVYQLLRYGVSATTLLWMLPYGVCGLAVGRYAARRGFCLSRGRLVGLAVGGELIITALNTLALYVDSLVYGYEALLFVLLAPRLLLAAAKGAAFAAVLPGLLRAARRALPPGEGVRR